jgi:hypothetical protein
MLQVESVETQFHKEALKYTYQEAREAALATAARPHSWDEQQSPQSGLLADTVNAQSQQEADAERTVLCSNSNTRLESEAMRTHFQRSRSSSSSRSDPPRLDAPCDDNVHQQMQWKQASSGICFATASPITSANGNSGSLRSGSGLAASLPGGAQWGLISAPGGADPYGLPGEEAACTLHGMRDWLGEQEYQMAEVWVLSLLKMLLQIKNRCISLYTSLQQH